MEALLLAHEADLRFYLLVALLGLLGVWEGLQPLRQPVMATGYRWLVNIALMLIGGFLAASLFPVLAVSLASLAAAQGWGLLNTLSLPFWLVLLLTVPLLDLSRYLQHRLLHRLPLLWRLHTVHHSDIDYDISTGLRFHPGETLFRVGCDSLLLLLLGIPPLAVLVSECLTLMANFFQHGNIALSERSNRWLRRLLVTPAMHRIHHSSVLAEENSNYATIFSGWDRLFGTYCAAPAGGQMAMSLGLADLRQPEQLTLWRLLLLPLRSADTRPALGLGSDSQ